MVTDTTPPLGFGASGHIKVYYQFHTMFTQMHQEIVHLRDILNVHLRYQDTIDHPQNHSALVDDTETTTSSVV